MTTSWRSIEHLLGVASTSTHRPCSWRRLWFAGGSGTISAMPNHSITPDLADHGDLTMHVRINQWLDALVADYDAHGHRMGIMFTLDEPRRGQRYVRVVQSDLDGGARSVHAFYDQRTGDVYKAAGWKAPAKIVRFNLLDNDSYASMIQGLDWAGGYLYLR